jgi:ELWxxDGT repeat protein
MPVAIFAANDGVHGVELWRTDGTTGGTQLLKDIKPGVAGSQIGRVTKSGDYIYFTAVDDTGVGLWRTDGTEAGTIRLNLLTTTEGELFDHNGTLYFSNGPTGSTSLWKSDGTVAGTVEVINTYNPSFTNTPINLIGSTDLGVMFIARGALWRSGGTAETTLQLAPISSFNDDPVLRGAASLGGALIFSAGSQNNGRELWRSDGTPEGTGLLRDLWPGTAWSSPRDFVQFNGALYFIADGPGGSKAMWRTDGTAAGTVAVRELANLSNIATDGTKLFIAAGANLWVSDGTTAGTTFVRALPTGTAQLTVSDGIAYFHSYVTFEPNSFVELWRSDGTEAGTFVTRDIRPGTLTSNPQNLTPFDSGLIFTADDGITGNEIWFSDGTEAGTNLVADIHMIADRSPSLFVNARNLVEFTTPGGAFQVLFEGSRTGNEFGLWRSDGQAGIELQRFTSGSLGQISGLTPVGDKVFFFAEQDLWTTTGTGAPTLVKDSIVLPPFSGNPPSATGIAYQGQFFFLGRQGGSKDSLFRSDGTTAGTVLVKQFVSTATPDFEIAGGKLFFIGTDPEDGREVWVSDGTEAGTFMVKDIVPGRPTLGLDTLPLQLTPVGDIVYFSARSIGSNQGSDRELWRTDGTEAGTFRVKDIRAGTASSDPTDLIRIGNSLFFTANDGVNGRELWKSDGTEAGTVMVKNIRPDVTNTGPTNLVAVINKLFFFANDGAGERLWVSDGTAAGTVQVPGLGVGVQNLTRVGGLALFTYDDGTRGRELWVSDGTAAGTHILVELAPGVANIQIEEITVENFTYFELFNAATGWELWRTDGTAAGTVPITDTSNPGASNAYGFAVLGTFNEITGTSGNDQLQGTAGPDRLLGLAGDDLLNGGLGADVLDGGGGFDFADYRGSAGGVFVNLTAGTGQGSEAEGDRLTGIEAVIGSELNDVLTGNAGANNLFGRDGADALYGLAGDDFLSGGFGGDQMFGGDGVDTVSYAGNFGGVWIDLPSGVGKWNFAEGDVIGGVENVIGTDFTDWLTGDGANNRLDGGSGDDRLIGGAGNDVLIGGFGADLLDGGADVDTADYSGLFGGVWINLQTGVGKWNSAEGDTLSGIDKLIGTDFTDWFESSTGRTDVFAGGAANDLFIFQAGFGQDVITDFQGNGAAAGDTIRFGAGTFADYAAVQAAMTQQGNDVLITLNAGNILTLQNTTIAQLNAQDFLFG